jgi:polar amino acid transport system substrate-binding protein
MWRLAISVVVFSLFILTIAVEAVAQPRVSLRADFWCPFNCLPDSDRPGLLIEIAEQAFGEGQVDYQLMNWARAVEATRLGGYSGVIGAFSGDAPDFIFPDLPLAHTRNCFYISDTDWTYQGRQSLRRIRLGVGNGYDYGRKMAGYMAAHQNNAERLLIATGDRPTSRNIELLMLGRIDALIESEDVMRYLLAEGHTQGIRQAGCIDELTPMYIAFSPANPDSQRQVEQLSATVRELKANGKLAELLARYGLHNRSSLER